MNLFVLFRKINSDCAIQRLSNNKQVTPLLRIGLKDMKGQNLPKFEKLRQVSLITASSLTIEQYFIRYLTFQNKLVKKTGFDTKE